jgi:hypothetical protein
MFKIIQWVWWILLGTLMVSFLVSWLGGLLLICIGIGFNLDEVVYVGAVSLGVSVAAILIFGTIIGVVELWLYIFSYRPRHLPDAIEKYLHH